jgi:hypothetical protein
MKKSLVFAFAALIAVAVFTSCNGNNDLTEADLQGYTFVGADTDGSNYSLAFPLGDSFAFTVTIVGAPSVYGGTFSVAGTEVTLTYSDGITKEVLGSDGPKKLLYETIVGENTPETVILQRQ